MTKHLIEATIVNRQGKILARGRNDYQRSHPVQASWAKRAGKPERIYLHAEIAALIRLKEGAKPYRIIVKRIRKDGTTALAAPCVVCQAAIKHWGIKRVEYTL